MSKDVWQRKFAILDWFLESACRPQYDNPATDQAILSSEASARDWAVEGAVKDAQDDELKTSLDKFLNRVGKCQTSTT